MSSNLVSERFILAERPGNRPVRESDFRFERVPVPDPGEGAAVLRMLYLSLDPYMRGRMSAAKSYAKPVEIGEVMTGEGLGQVLVSRHPGLKAGDIVRARSGWQTHAVVDGAAAPRIEPVAGVPLSHHLGVLGMPGATAYFALLGIGRPQVGETVLISAASGAVGQVAGQIAKIKGSKVIATAGDPDKLAFVTEELGFDRAISYKGKTFEALSAELAEAAPQGIDVFFDNVGGVTHDAAMHNLALGARVIICGAISIYDRLDGPDIGIRWNRQLLIKRALIQGFLVSDHEARYPEFRAEVAGWLKAGKIRYREDIAEGIAATPRAFIGMLAGQNRGKQLVHLADPA